MQQTTVYYSVIDSPIDPLLLSGDGERLRGVQMGATKPDQGGAVNWHRDDALFAAARAQLQAYFGGELKEFDLPLDLAGTGFQCEVWAALQAIPFGVTASYAELAERVGRPRAVRAVGQANGRNPLAIVVPCHRVIGADGSLTGYAGGVARKQWLLRHEGVATVQRTMF
ncbi:methylated-DNA--[protein]-cysteine S-methyltransferase [Mangrovimicrobium sediminis]|uniref:Methylated-DNA--protein-cysteine methyltransferase n=1 Tax=Mangrovimicrobium sediminis TaxID=2562682 RepID=A0A4Z0M701_9GAMM|nr:methylated-DNA--[protein]-cysteine S-methyltransferase [Haliea sp. SAOS-164]TGD75301.1 methylated-DNA--[protein]-cysteine S-methyltransferase [Haliea sp. SAOS-164]